jgi:hypothetical protein
MLLTVPNAISWAEQYRFFDASGEFTRLWVYPSPLRAVAYLARSHRWLVFVSIAFFLPVAAIYLLAGKGVCARGLPAADLRFLLLAVLGYLLIASTVPGYADDRLRVPFIPILCIFAGIGWAGRSGRG